VTGGAGFIGSHVVDKLSAAGLTPRIFDMVPSPFHEPGTIETYLGDLSDTDALTDALDGCSAVLHLAAVADVNQVVLDPAFAEAVNARGTLNVLEPARAADVGRVVYASTIWVYNGLAGPTVDEDTMLGLPTHLYTATKVAGEMYCTSYAELYGVEFTILRFGIP
jgi:UDP-glucose 4-epimerase